MARQKPWLCALQSPAPRRLASPNHAAPPAAMLQPFGFGDDGRMNLTVSNFQLWKTGSGPKTSKTSGYHRSAANGLLLLDTVCRLNDGTAALRPAMFQGQLLLRHPGCSGASCSWACDGILRACLSACCCADPPHVLGS